MKRFFVYTAIFQLTAVSFLLADLPADYKGKPFADEKYKDGPQSIPGCVECAYYDLGGEGVAYHSAETFNEGANKLNLDPHHHRPQSNEYYWTFRKDDALSTSYTKDFVDFTDKNLYQPKFNQLYIGWTADGEWTNYTVNVKKPGKYRIFIVYSYKPNTIKFSINNKPAGEYKLPVDTGYYHHWNRAEIGEIEFSEAGLQLLTFFFNAPKEGGNNFAYFEFFPVEDDQWRTDDKPAPVKPAASEADKTTEKPK